MAAALLAGWLVPVPVVPDAVQGWVGGAMIVLSLGLFVASVQSFRRHGTTMVVRGAPSAALMISGPYGFSRNPIYLAMIGLSFGIGIAADTIWIVPALAVAVWYLRRNVIDLEERYLAGKFGDAYRDYAARVRRWL